MQFLQSVTSAHFYAVSETVLHNSLPFTLDATALGHYIAEQEQARYDAAVMDVFGYHAVQIGWQGYDLLKHSRIPNKHYLNPSKETRTSVLCECEYLPFAEAAVDLVCMPHVLEKSSQAQQALREVYRVLVPDGTVILTGVSPVSLLGLRARVGWFRRAGQFRRLLPAWRIRDWLEVLGFEVVASGKMMHVIPVNHAHWLARQHFLECWGAHSHGLTGGLYYVIARKRILNMRLLKPDWKKAAIPRALSTGKTHGRVQKQLECADENATVDRDVC